MRNLQTPVSTKFSWRGCGHLRVTVPMELELGVFSDALRDNVVVGPLILPTMIEPQLLLTPSPPRSSNNSSCIIKFFQIAAFCTKPQANLHYGFRSTSVPKPFNLVVQNCADDRFMQYDRNSTAVSSSM